MIRPSEKNRSITEDRARADYTWPTKEAAQVVRLHPNKFGAWWYANRAKLKALSRSHPRETAQELLKILSDL